MTPKSINIAVAEQVEKLGSGKVVETVVERLVQAEVVRRADALAAVIKLSEEAAKNVRKADKPDQVFIAADGTKTVSYSQKAFDEKNKAEAQVKKIDETVVAAIDKGEWGKLYELINKAGSKADDKADDSK